MSCRGSILALAALISATQGAAEIQHVTHQPAIFDPAAGESAEVRFRLADASESVVLTLYDARGVAVRTLHLSGVIAPGDHRMAWDGRDERGQPVPAEAYIYTLEARSAQGEVTKWDLPTSGGEKLDVADVVSDPSAGAVRYRISDPARVRIRIGLAEGGPLLRTLVDWAPRAPGSHAEAWDGRDASNVLTLSEHPALLLEASAFALPRNAILVGPPAARPAFVAGLAPDAARRAESLRGPQRRFDYARQAVADRSDFVVRLTLPDGLDRTREGVPIVRAPVPVRVDASGADLVRMANERAESVFFVDGRFVFERETGFLPITWTWDPRGHGPGLHHLSANIQGYEGHFGIGTALVWVESPEAGNR